MRCTGATGLGAKAQALKVTLSGSRSTNSPANSAPPSTAKSKPSVLVWRIQSNANESSPASAYERDGPHGESARMGWSAWGPHGPHAIPVCSSREVIDEEMIFMRTMRTMRTKGNMEGEK